METPRITSNDGAAVTTHQEAPAALLTEHDRSVIRRAAEILDAVWVFDAQRGLRDSLGGSEYCRNSDAFELRRIIGKPSWSPEEELELQLRGFGGDLDHAEFVSRHGLVVHTSDLDCGPVRDGWVVGAHGVTDCYFDGVYETREEAEAALACVLAVDPDLFDQVRSVDTADEDASLSAVDANAEIRRRLTALAPEAARVQVEGRSHALANAIRQLPAKSPRVHRALREYDNAVAEAARVRAGGQPS